MMTKGIFFLSCLFFPSILQAQSLKGTIRDDASNETLIGVNVFIKGTVQGIQSDINGKFEFVPKTELPFTLVFSYVGYTSLELEITSLENPINVRLKSSEVKLKDVEIVDSRLTEKEKESPLTIETMDIIAIKATPAANFYDGLGQLKGVDLTASSLGFKVVNTRGFNSTRPVRSLQLIDGVDNQAPGLNFSLGNFLGACELDVQKVELVVGASSAMYGPNAFNGVINMTTKSPFVHQGLSLTVKGAERNYVDAGFRYAKAFKINRDFENFAFKFNGFFMKASDWEAVNYDATEQSFDGSDNWGGYDAVNIYGDENLTSGTSNFTDKYGKRNFPGLGRYYRTGYKEEDLVNYDTKNIKLSGSLHYMLTKNIEASYGYNFGSGTTVYQGDNRYNLRDIEFQQHKIEIRQQDKFFVRAYTTNEDAGKSYDVVFTALLLQEGARPFGNWAKDYSVYWTSSIVNKVRNLPGYPNPNVNPSIWFGPNADKTYALADSVMNVYKDSLIKWHQQARDYADSRGFFEPGTPEFDSAFASTTSKTAFTEGGSRFYDKSALSHIQGEYKFTPKLLDITIGGSFRQYNPDSKGTIFSDTADHKIANREFGFYTGLEKKLFAEQLKVNATARLDKNENFDFLISPAASLVYVIDEKQNVRASFSSAIRNPTLQDQYLYYNVGRAILIGNIDGVDSLITLPSLNNYYYALNYDTLEFFNVDPVRPEKVKSLEIGYKGSLFKNTFIDASYYYSIYKDFLGFKIGSKPSFDPSTGLINANQVYRVSANSPDVVTSQGFSLGINYYFLSKYAVTGNYSWNKLDKRGSTDPIIPAFNTPENKFNIGVNGRDIKNFGFSINYKWIQGFVYEGSPQFTGTIPSYDLLDAQVSYFIQKIKTTVKIGASNILNKKRFQAYGGPYIGRMAYISASVDLK